MFARKKEFLFILTFCLIFFGCSNAPKVEPVKNYKIKFYEDDEIVKEFTVPENTYVSACQGYDEILNYFSIKYDGFRFNGWFNKDGNKFEDIYIKADAEYYASFSAKVKFYKKTSDENSLFNKYYDVGLSIPTEDFPKIDVFRENFKDYHFLYWSENPEATDVTRKTDEFVNEITSSKAEVNLYAVYSTKNVYTVNFYTNSKTEIKFSKEIIEGEKITLTSSDRKDISYHYFLYWTESLANQTEAESKSFDIENDVVTKNMSLYGVYTPKLFLSLNNSDIVNGTDLVKGTIKFSVYTNEKHEIFKFDDETIPNLEVSYLINGNKTIISSENCEFTDEGSYSEITYFFEMLSEGTYTFTVSNSVESRTISKKLYEPAAVTNLAVTTDDSYAKLTWTNASGYYAYTVTVLKGSAQVTVKNIQANSIEFYGLDNNVEYTFQVKTTGTNKVASVKGTSIITKKESDWVIAMYMDGDNNLNDNIYKDMNEVEYGLYQISGNSNYDTVNVVALWDGYNVVSEYIKVNHPGSYIFEIGKDSGIATTTVNSSGYVLSSSTKNLSYTAKDWILSSSSTPDNITASSYGEVNMGSEATLENFLNWVKTHYTANKGYIIQFSDHGGGPKKARYLELKDGRKLVTDNEERRALCWDESNLSSYLSTVDVSTALNNAGFTGENKADMIIMDVCLGASIEESYQFAPYAKYLVASPNTIPADGLPYDKVIKAFKKNCTVEEVSKQIIQDYADYYHKAINWSYYYLYYLQEINPQIQSANISNITAEELEILNSNYAAMRLGIPTLSVIDLNAVNTAAEKIAEMAQLLINDANNPDGHKLYFHEIVDEDTNEVYLSLAVGPDDTTVTKSFAKGFADMFLNYPNCIYGALFYQGTYNWLIDIGDFTDWIRVYTVETLQGISNPYYWKELNDKCIEVLIALEDMILYSWKDFWDLRFNNICYNYYQQNAYTYRGLSFEDNYCGLTICGATIASNGNLLIPGTAPNFYTNLDFGKVTSPGNYWNEYLQLCFSN